MRNDLKNNIGMVLLLEPQDLAHTDTTSDILDTKESSGVVMSVVFGALTGVDADNYVTPVLQESDTTADADFTDVDSENIEGGFTKIDAVTEDSVVQWCGYKGNKRYIRTHIVYAGSGITAGVGGVLGLLGRTKEAPVTAPAAISAT